MTGRDRLLAALAPDLVEAIDQLVEESVRETLATVGAPSSPWLSIVEAAELLRCKRQRVDDLLSQGRLARYKDGSRTLVSRIELEEYLRKQRA